MRPRPLALALVGAVVLAACGKSGGSPQQGGGPRVAGTYHLAGAARPTNLELREDGTFTLRADSCDSSGVLICGGWKSSGPPHVIPHEGLYWPTPDEFPSAVIRGVTMGLRSDGGELLVVGTSDWAGAFTQRWSRGRTCAVCSDRLSRGERPCAEPLPACAPL